MDIENTLKKTQSFSNVHSATQTLGMLLTVGVHVIY